MHLTFRWPCIVINSYNKTNQMHKFLKFIFGIKLYMFWTVPLSIIRSFSLYTQQWYMPYRFAVRKPVRHIPLLCIQWKTPDDGQRNCPKHVEFYSKNKFEKLVHLVGFIIGTHMHNAWHANDDYMAECIYAEFSIRKVHRYEKLNNRPLQS